MIKIVPIESVRASTYNPRKSDPARLRYLEMSLRKMGFVHPIFADETGEIISGHQRHYVATRMGCTKVPVTVMEHVSLERRKAINLVFNRGTNDLKQNDTCESVTEYLQGVDIEQIASALPDIAVDSPEFFPCMRQVSLPLSAVWEKNTDLMHDYACMVYGMLDRHGGKMPVILDEDYRVLNGIGRVMYAGKMQRKTILAVILDKKKAEFCRLMMNYLTMDFDIKNRYADTLRYNSFMRATQTRNGGLGCGFYKGIYKTKKCTDFPLLIGEVREKWVERFGTSVVDFGAGKLTNTHILRDSGISVSAFEPYFIAVGEHISKEVSLKINRKFLSEIADGREFSAIFIASVFNSVPFMEDRKHIACICSALSGPNTVVVCWTQGEQSGRAASMNAETRNKNMAQSICFRVDYEPRIVLGEYASRPKVQKYHSLAEIHEIFGEHFNRIRRLEYIDNFCYSEACEPKVDLDKLRAALEFEFDLPYPDGTTMGLVDEAKAAFGQRLGVTL